MYLLIIILIILIFYLIFYQLGVVSFQDSRDFEREKTYDFPVFVSSRGFTTEYRPYDFYDSLKQDLVFETK